MTCDQTAQPRMVRYYVAVAVAAVAMVLGCIGGWAVRSDSEPGEPAGAVTPACTEQAAPSQVSRGADGSWS